GGWAKPRAPFTQPPVWGGRGASPPCPARSTRQGAVAPRSPLATASEPRRVRGNPGRLLRRCPLAPGQDGSAPHLQGLRLRFAGVGAHPDPRRSSLGGRCAAGLRAPIV